MLSSLAHFTYAYKQQSGQIPTPPPPPPPPSSASYFGFDSCSPILHYGMYNASVIDDSGNGYNPAHQNNVDTTQSITGDGRYSLNGNGLEETVGTAYIQANANVAFPATAQTHGFSVAFWLYPTDNNTNSKCIFSINDYIAMGQPTNETRTWVYTNFAQGNQNSLYYMPLLTMDTWNHIIINFNPNPSTTAHRFWLNGTEVFPTNNGKVHYIPNYPTGVQNNILLGKPSQTMAVGYNSQGYFFDNFHNHMDDVYILNQTAPLSDYDVIRLRETSPMTAFYTFENFTGSTLKDDCRVYDATISGGCVNTTRSHNGSYSATFESGVVSNVATKYITLPEISMAGSGLSISAWIWTDAGNLANDSCVFEMEGDTGSITNLKLYTYASDRTKYRLGADTGTIFYVATGQWNHIVITIDAIQGTKIYVNGTLTINITYQTTIKPTTKIDAGGFLGRALTNAGNIRTHPGSIDHIRIYNNVLSQNAVNVLYDNGNGD